MRTFASHSAILLRSILLTLLIVAQVIVPATGEPLTCEALCGAESRAHMDCGDESCGAEKVRLHAGTADSGCEKDHHNDPHRNHLHKNDPQHSLRHGSERCGEDHYGSRCSETACGDNICHEEHTFCAETGHSSDTEHNHDGTSCQLQGCHCCAFIMFLTDTYAPAQPSLYSIRFWPASLDATIDPRPAPPDHPPC